MTDASQLIPNSMAVSSDCLYNLKPSSVPGRVYRASIPTSNKSTFNPSDVAVLYIPAGRRNTFLDPTQSYLKFCIQNYDTNNAISCDNNASCVINRLDTFSGSNLLETVQQYNVIYSYLVDFQMSFAARYGASSMYGTGDVVSGSGIRQGAILNTATSASVPNKVTVCMPVLSSVFGLGADKLVPIGLLGDDLRVEISFEQQPLGMVYASTNATQVPWQITNVELELAIIELSDQGMSMVNSVTPFNAPIYLHGNGYRHYASSLPANISGTYSTLVPARFASLKQLIALPRRATEISSATSYSLTSRVNPNILNYWWRVGPYLIPNKPVTLSSTSGNVGGYAEAYMEILRSQHALSHVDSGACISFDEFNVQDAAADTTVTSVGISTVNTGANSFKNAFAIAQELEMWAMRIISGMNTLSSQVFFEATIGATAPTTAYTVDFYANFDVIFILENGLLSARY